MIVELINTGTELLLGQIANSHQQWLCRELSNLGYTVARQAAIPDRAEAIQLAVRESLSRADLVIVTGGLGPTTDDLTRESVAALLAKPLKEDPGVLGSIEALFKMRGRAMPGRVKVQALVPEGATILPNLHGTAPGLALRVVPNPFRDRGEESWLILLPGPGRELRPMFAQAVIPFLRSVAPPREGFQCRILRTTGIAESIVQERIKRPLEDLVRGGLDLGYCARPGQVDVRLAAVGGEAAALLNVAEKRVRELLAEDVFGTADQTLEEVVIRLLEARRQTVAVAESCTGGCICNRLTNVPGASAVFRNGWITYSNKSKQQLLGVPGEILDRFGAVSEPVASEMAAGARRVSGADYALAVTGIAGPSGGTPEKPVGTVFIALASGKGVQTRHWCNPWDRLTFKDVTSQQALNQLRLSLQKSG